MVYSGTGVQMPPHNGSDRWTAIVYRCAGEDLAETRRADATVKALGATCRGPVSWSIVGTCLPADGRYA